MVNHALCSDFSRSADKPADKEKASQPGSDDDNPVHVLLHNLDSDAAYRPMLSQDRAGPA